jgi:predicted DNA-binding transcriptional regulator AlpA
MASPDDDACPQVPDAPRPLPEDGLLRLRAILHPGGPIPVSRSSWWAGVKIGRFPAPVRLGPKTRAWRAADIRALIAKGSRK